MSRLLRGILAGIAGTASMSLLMFVGAKTGLLHTPPPKKITKRAQQKVGINPRAMPEEVFQASWVLAHVGYGAASGAVFALARPVIPGPAVLRGLLYGWALWAVSYFGLLPALGLYPSPDEDSPSQTAIMVAAHAVYGVTLAEVAGQEANGKTAPAA